MLVSLLGLAPNLHHKAIAAGIVLCVGASLLRIVQSANADAASKSWVPLTVLLGTPAFGGGVVLWGGLIDGGNSRSLEDAFSILPVVLILGLVAGVIAATVLKLTQRRSPVRQKAETAESGNELQQPPTEL